MARRIRQWIGYLIMVAGLGLLAGPFLLGAREEQSQSRVVDAFYKSREEARTIPPTGLATEVQETIHQSPTIETSIPPETIQEPEPTQQPQEESQPEPPKQTQPEIVDPFYQAAADYNASLLQNGQDKMTRRSDVEHFAISALDYGYEENIIGVIQIPRMEIELGLYLGASDENMAKGSAIFGMTSLPLGQESENVAIAGHRGWHGSPMFREIQKLQMDDPIYISTPWQTLTYRVCEIRIVTPSDNTWCKIQEGRTLISLMT